MPLGKFLFEYLYRRGVRHSFGVPGDFALPTYSWLEKSKIQSVTVTHEPSAGFAADAYARINGIGLVCVTYCVGGLNVLNAIAGAYAEKSPVVVVSGAPGRKDREKDPLLHHKVKTFETQRRVYDEVTVASTVLLDEQRAASEVARCVEACLQHKRPVYIEVPHDMVDREVPIVNIATPPPQQSDPHTLNAAVAETLELIRNAKKPVILAGVELARYRTAGLVLRMAEKMNIPIAADLLSKSAIPEDHRLYLGVYGGAMSSDEHVRKYVESADLVLMLGTFITDMSMGFYTAKLDRRRTVLATTERVTVQYHRYESIQFRDFLEHLVAVRIKPKRFRHPNPDALPKPLKRGEYSKPLSIADVFRILSLHLDEHSCVVADIGDAIFGAVGIRSARQPQFIAPAYYMSMGFAVPGGIGVALATKRLRPYVLVGDGAFQMTGTEISTAVRLGLNPIVIVLNNDGYGTMRQIREGTFNTITQWNYSKICDLVGGGKSLTVTSKGQFDGALTRAKKSKQVFVIEVKVPRSAVSDQLAQIAREVRKVRGTGDSHPQA
ncbi:MAG TPA: thiamine pyrophosphate-binding protein [Chthoniobacterales bacterium]|nr:thiamine pyrophosphate-binding protein [Chthoniobacterales bacterium]